jgi:hypothetical protein
MRANSDIKFTESFFENLRKTIAWTQDIMDTIKDPAQINYLRILRSVNPDYEGRRMSWRLRYLTAMNGWRSLLLYDRRYLGPVHLSMN